MQTVYRHLVEHGYYTLALAALLERLGIPLFITPVIIAAGLLAANAQLDLLGVIAVTTVATLLGDSFWFQLGRWRGTRVTDFLCRISLSKDSCVRKTQAFSSRFGNGSLLYSKWVPGVAHLTPVVAGTTNTSFIRFAALNSIGTFLWVAALAMFGWLSMRPLEWTTVGAAIFGLLPLWLLLILVGNVLWKYVQRQRFTRALRIERIAPLELSARLNGPENDRPTVIDLRHPLDVLANPQTIPGAISIAPEDIERRASQMPLDREFVLVCT